MSCCVAARPAAWKIAVPGLPASRIQQRAAKPFSPRAAAARCRRPAAFRVAAQAAPAPWKANAPVAPGQELTLELPTTDVQQSVELLALPRGRGKVIVVALVDPRSEAAAAGVKAGQQVLAISDPIRAGETWELDGKSALKYVQQAIRGRGLDTLTLRLTTGTAPEYERLVAGMAAEGGAGDSADLQSQLVRLQQAAKAQDRALQEARLAKRAVAIAEGRAKLERDTDAPPVLGGPALGAGLFMLLPLTIVVAALASGYLK